MNQPPPPLPPLPAPTARLPLTGRNRSGWWLSLIVHLVLLLVLVEATRGGFWWDAPQVAGDPLRQIGGGGGGRQVTMVMVPPATKVAAPVPKVVPPMPVPTVVPKEIPPPVPAPPADTIPKAVETSPTTGTSGGAGGGSGGGSGPGTGPGSGPGSGGSGTVPADSARTLGREPEQRQLILPPFPYPPSMRGRTIAVTFFVLADGRVDRVLFSEDLPDHGYEKKLKDAMLAYLFRPARSPAGLPVNGHTVVSITF